MSCRRRAGDGQHGKVAETVAINPAFAISGIEILNHWYYNPASLAIMQDCAHTLMGVWSENTLDRTVVVAVYGRPADGADRNPDYDGSDELEYGISWLPWVLRGVYPPPAYPPSSGTSHWKDWFARAAWLRSGRHTAR
jgi:hypothetical protein